VQPEQRLTSATLGRSLSKRQRLACAGAGQAACTARACRAAAARQPDGAGERARGARQRGAQLPAALRTAVARASRVGRVQHPDQHPQPGRPAAEAGAVGKPHLDADVPLLQHCSAQEPGLTDQTRQTAKTSAPWAPLVEAFKPLALLVFGLTQKSMSGIAVSEDAVNMYYYLKAKSTVRPALPQRLSAVGPSLCGAGACQCERRVLPHAGGLGLWLCCACKRG
jgi:hypothetical protein